MSEYLQQVVACEQRRDRLDARDRGARRVRRVAPRRPRALRSRARASRPSPPSPSPPRSGTFSRFPSAPSFMSYLGLVPSEDSSGDRVERGKITRTGNGHVRALLVEAAWQPRQEVEPAAADGDRGAPGHRARGRARRRRGEPQAPCEVGAAEAQEGWRRARPTSPSRASSPASSGPSRSARAERRPDPREAAPAGVGGEPRINYARPRGPCAVLEGGRPAPDRSECAATRGYQTGDR